MYKYTKTYKGIEVFRILPNFYFDKHEHLILNYCFEKFLDTLGINVETIVRFLYQY